MRIKFGIAAVALAALTLANPAQAADVICYNCPPQWADWASMLKAIKADLGYDIPHAWFAGDGFGELVTHHVPIGDFAGPFPFFARDGRLL